MCLLTNSSEDSDWACEKQTDHMKFCLKYSKEIVRKRSKFQEILLVETYEYGKVLFLDGLLQTTERDEAYYHELLVHVPLFSLKDPKEVLIIGGGDGGSLREALKHGVHVDIVEIDEEVVNISKEHLFFPKDGNYTLIIDDGHRYLKNTSKKYDAIIIDGSDPIGPAGALFREDFFCLLKDHIKEDGVVCLQAGSPVISERHNYFFKTWRELKKIFEIVKAYVYFVPTYPTGMWGYVVASQKVDPEIPKRFPNENFNLKVYTPELHTAVFRVPKHIKERLK